MSGSYGYAPGIVGTDTYVPDALRAGDFPLVTQTVTVLHGGAAPYGRGTVMGQVTASGKWTPSASAAVDGSQVPAGILIDRTDATAADVTAAIYVAGDFNSNALTFGAGMTLALAEPALRDHSIFLHASVKAAPV